MARARYCLTGAVLALSLVGVSSVANSQTSSSTSVQTTQTQTSPGQTVQSTTVQTSYITTPTGAYETYLPSIPNAQEALALQAIMDAGITTRDIELILPLLRDLRNEQHWLQANTDQAISDLVAARSSSEVKQTGTAAVQDAAQKFRDHRDHIWSTIADRIGAAKADTLRSIVNPPLGNPAFAQDFNERMSRIDSLIARLNSFGNGTQTASTTETTTSTTVTTGLSQPPTADQVNTLISTWPDSSKSVAQYFISKYGPPSEATADMLTWRNNGPWVRTIVYRENATGAPAGQNAVVQQVIDYHVPADKASMITDFGNGIVVNDATGEVTVYGNGEASDYLALNLMNDIATGKKTVDEARTFYNDTNTAITSGQSPAYGQSFQFQVQNNSGAVSPGAVNNANLNNQTNGSVVNASMGQTMPLAEMTAFQTVLAGAVDLPRPHLTIDDLVMLLEQKVLAGEALDVTGRVMPWYPGYVTPESIKYLHDTELNVWK